MYASEGGEQVSANSYVYKDAQEASSACDGKDAGSAAGGLGCAPVCNARDFRRINSQTVFAELAKEHLIDPADFPENNVRRIQAEFEPKTAARLYADEIRKFFRLKAGEFPESL
jgi:hypothetical protein